MLDSTVSLNMGYLSIAYAAEHRPEDILPALRDVLRGVVSRRRAARLAESPFAFAVGLYADQAGVPRRLAERACLNESDAEWFEATYWKALRHSILAVEMDFAAGLFV